ncbi:MAG: fumarylacetoacetate hydrolase family protein [Phycisphaerales bacterium]|nr:fumarylacetoacetate hydrolase family protein [Phycisphaerales bacterium]
MTSYELVRSEFGVGIQTGSGVLPLRHIIGIGRNYAEHAKEQSADVPTRPMVFTKSPASASLSGDDIVIPTLCRDAATGGEQTDFEAELCVILGSGPSGRVCKDVSAAEAMEFVFGYTCANDVSARWWQKEGSGGQFCRGKSFDSFCPLGPRVVPRDAIKDPQDLRVICRVNGNTMQDGRTRDMIFPVANLISDLSRGMTLFPGTIILTGTPSGVGMARKPPVWLKEGDVVEVEIPEIGVLRNRVRNAT